MFNPTEVCFLEGYRRKVLQVAWVIHTGKEPETSTYTTAWNKQIELAKALEYS